MTPAELEKLNAANQEPWWASGVGVFGSGGVLWCLGIIFNQIGTHGGDLAAYDLETMVAAGGGLVSTAGVLYRRYMPGLKPMFAKWWAQ